MAAGGVASGGCGGRRHPPAPPRHCGLAQAVRLGRDRYAWPTFSGGLAQLLADAAADSLDAIPLVSDDGCGPHRRVRAGPDRDRDTGRHLLSSALRPPARTPHVSHGKRVVSGILEPRFRKVQAMMFDDAIEAFADLRHLARASRCNGCWTSGTPPPRDCRACCATTSTASIGPSGPSKALFVVILLLVKRPTPPASPICAGSPSIADRCNSVSRRGSTRQIILPADPHQHVRRR